MCILIVEVSVVINDMLLQLPNMLPNIVLQNTFS
jgi:hypothetical protein